LEVVLARYFGMPIFRCFSLKGQMLTTYQTNNTGDNVASQLKKLTIEDLLNQFENNSEKIDWLAVQQLANPKISEKMVDNYTLIVKQLFAKAKERLRIACECFVFKRLSTAKGFTNTVFYAFGYN
jgi:hypothetical protein